MPPEQCLLPAYPNYDPIQANPPWLAANAQPFQLPIDRPRTAVEHGAFGAMAQYAKEVRYEPPLDEYPAYHMLHISTEGGEGTLRVLSHDGRYKSLIIFGELIEDRVGKGGSVSSLSDGRLTARKILNGADMHAWRTIDLDGGWRRLVPRRWRIAGYLAGLLESASPSLPRPRRA